MYIQISHAPGHALPSPTNTPGLSCPTAQTTQPLQPHNRTLHRQTYRLHTILTNFKHAISYTSLDALTTARAILKNMRAPGSKLEDGLKKTAERQAERQTYRHPTNQSSRKRARQTDRDDARTLPINSNHHRSTTLDGNVRTG